MNEPDYRTLLALLDSANLLLAQSAGALSPADLRIRSLVNITAKETQRALLEIKAAARLNLAADDETREKQNAPPAQPNRADVAVAR